MTNFEDFHLSSSFLGGTSKLAIHRRLDGISKVQKADWNPNSKTYGLPGGFLGENLKVFTTLSMTSENFFEGFWFSGSWTKEFEGPGSHLKELRRFRTSFWRTWKNFEVQNAEERILILESKTKCFSTPKIPETKMISTWSRTPKEIGSNLDTGILQGNRLQFGYQNPARKSAPICHPTGNVLIFWKLRNLTYTGFPDAWKFSKVILNGYFTFQVFRQLEY
ncbi:hypothetical protein RIR_jg17125.t1 [Rhizophagus irregularis DAOM 181602=DAOM 197198]|nr:hypothetical protein RIR_jg17125.t1 [Rhizophagus irregularis DAOM 181602=DAOM 197198]